MNRSTSKAQQFRFSQSPRRNLPARIANKRGESSFVNAFAKWYINDTSGVGIGGREFAISGLGIADFVWLAWSPSGEDGTALSIERLQSLLTGHRLTAFEMKLTDWRKGLVQAFRYSYFADRVIVVVPPNISSAAARHVEVFRDLNVGLWSFDPKTEKTVKHFTPRAKRPKNRVLHQRAMELLSRKVYLRQRCELRQCELQRF